MNIFRNSAASGLIVGIVFSLPGCGGGADDAPDLVDASGRVTVDGKPAAGYRVAFTTDLGTTTGVTNSSGDYTIEYNDDRYGARPGKTTVVVRKMDVQEYADNSGADDEDDDADFDAIEARAAKTQGEWNIKINVKEGGDPYNFVLKSADMLKD